jgi:hypothetical protein
MTNKENDLKCISLIGELSYLGKHFYFNNMGVTMCGCFTVNYDKEKIKDMPEGVTSEYKVEEWDITCERCLNLMNMVEQQSIAKKCKMN